MKILNFFLWVFNLGNKPRDFLLRRENWMFQVPWWSAKSSLIPRKRPWELVGINQIHQLCYRPTCNTVRVSDDLLRKLISYVNETEWKVINFIWKQEGETSTQGLNFHLKFSVLCLRFWRIQLTIKHNFNLEALILVDESSLRQNRCQAATTCFLARSKSDCQNLTVGGELQDAESIREESFHAKT